MISLNELKRAAAEEGIPFESTQKDYVIGWILWGLANHPTLSQEFVFKGGTALRKCYFREYRFSEDLDFTVQGKALNKDRLENDLRDCAQKISEASGIEVALAELSQTRDEENEEALKGKFSYRGPSKPVTTLPKIKLDITYYEKVIEEPLQRSIIQRYSDAVDTKVQVYTLEEIVAEKMRSMLQQKERRARPRDWYDVWFLLSNEDLDALHIQTLFHKKCVFKNVTFTGVEDYFDSGLIEKINRAWERSLNRQLKDVPPFKTVRTELRLLLENLHITA